MSKGFSLLELVAVLAIFAVVALIGVQVIQASVRSSERLTEISEEAEELAHALALLRHDLNSALPRRFTPPDGGSEPSLLAAPSGFSLSIGGLARIDSGATGFGRVIWRYDRAQQRVYRAVWPTLEPGGGRPVERAVLDGVTRFELSHYSAQGGWRAGYSADPRAPSALPLGLKVAIDHQRHDQLETIVSLR